jgi:N-acetylmuramic acid 6-phosphate etherase/N-acetylglucosamine-6-phosphate deacetylase
MIIAAPRLFLPGGFSGPGAVEIDHGRIVRIMPRRTDGDIVLPEGFLSPGMIDLHNNGAFGVDCAEAAPEDWDRFVAGLAEHGVTGVYPTVITAELPALHEAARRLAAAMPRHAALLGMHLEGPFLAEKRRGAHRAAWLLVPDEATLDALLAEPAMASVLRLITLAPELPGALAAIRRLTEAGVAVSLGHTDASAAEFSAGIDAGARLVTHVFNAQSPLAHRTPGAPGVALTDPRLAPCLIVDGVHVDPIVLQLAFAACPRAIAVTDSIVIAGLAEGATGRFGGDAVTMGGRGIGLRPDGTIAGAGITLDEGVRRLIAAGIAPETALLAATLRPAEAMGLADRGRLTPGARADLVWWRDDFSIAQVWTAGQAGAQHIAPGGPEHARAELMDLDARPTLPIVEEFLRQEARAQLALAAAAPALAALAEAVAARLRAGGRLFYVGAGTSGRLALLDAVECGPTFNAPAGLIVPVLAGGEGAFIQAVEGAEDDAGGAVDALESHGFSAGDALVGIAASGATPFTLAALRHAAALGALTGAIVNTADSPLAKAAALPVRIASGPEVIAGSTRLSAGTAQKIALNILSSTVMLRLGRVYGPYMVDMRASNAKLRRRAIRMVRAIAGADEAAARAALEACDLHVKTAIVMLRFGTDRAGAEHRLGVAEFSLRRALDTPD